MSDCNNCLFCGLCKFSGDCEFYSPIEDDREELIETSREEFLEQYYIYISDYE